MTRTAAAQGMGAVAALAAALCLTGCNRRAVPPPVRQDTAWWWWQAHSAPQPGPRVALLYVQVGTLEGMARSLWPTTLPPADRYVAVWRSNQRAIPGIGAVALVAATYARLRTSARESGVALSGVQIDIDIPTG